MIRIRRAVVRSAEEAGPDLVDLQVEVDGQPGRALAYPSLVGAVAEGDTVILNTTAVALGLGTGGFHLVIAVESGEDIDPPEEGHVMKLRYTPVQAKVLAVEEQGSPHHETMSAARSLDGMPVVWVPLHSMLAPAAAGALTAGAEAVVYVMTDGASLPLWLSGQVRLLREAGILAATVTTGQALGGDHEAVTIFSGLLAAKEIAGADVIVVADGPGKVGTGTPWGASDVASGMSVNAAAILGGRPVAAPRISFADPAYRHHGLSPHSITVLREVVQAPVHVAVPTLEGSRRDAVWDAIRAAGLEDRHQVVEAAGAPAIAALRDAGIAMESMGRSYEEDPELFLAGGAAGILAGRMAAGSARWRREAEA